MIDVEKLLAPISSDNPCGEDVSYAQDFMELDTLVMGKEATQFSDAVEPDWKLIHKRCEELSIRSKDLRVLILLSLSAVKLDGILGAAASLELLSKSLQNYWDTIYPRLDPDDNLDPLERVNILSSLASPIGTYGDPYKYLEKIAAVPLCRSASLGSYSFSSLPQRMSSGEKSSEVSQAEAAFLDTPPDLLQANFAAIDRSIQAVAEMETFLDSTIGATKSPNLEALNRQLLDIRKVSNAFAGTSTSNVADGAPSTDTPSSATSTPQTGGNAKAVSVQGSLGGINSRADVIKALDLICDYYRASEPSSPLPLLLQRARRLVEGDFLTIIDDLAPDSLALIRTVTGARETSSPY